MSYCPNCGTELSSEAKYCKECGTNVSETTRKTSSDTSKSDSISDTDSNETTTVIHHETSPPNWFTPLSDEKVVEVAVPGLVAYAIRMVFAGIVVGLLIQADIVGSSVFFTYIIITVLGYWILRRRHYIITDQRVVKKGGILNTATSEIRLEDIVNITTKSGFIEGLIEKGTVEITSTGKQSATNLFGSSGTITMSELRNYKTIANMIREQQK